MSINVKLVRSDFPILNQKVYGKPLIYFDNSATTQKPLTVIQTITDFYTNSNSSSHSQHSLAVWVTNQVETVRSELKNFFQAKHAQSFIFTKSATESINLVVQGLPDMLDLTAGDEIVLTELEHHANLVPYQVLARKLDLKLKFIPINSAGDLELDQLHNLLTAKTKFIAFSGLSNVLGKKISILEIIQKVRAFSSAKILIDATQLVVHCKLDLSQIDTDFLVFSGHKMYAPLGIGVLYGKKSLLEKLPPYQTGGEMVDEVSLQTTKYADLPYKFEAGTLNFAGVLGLGASLKYLQKLGLENILEYEKILTDYFLAKIQQVKTYKPLVLNPDVPIFSFNLKGVNSLDLASFLDTQGIAVRTGKHCTHPLYNKLKLESSCRASLSFYNTTEEIDMLIQALLKAERLINYK